VKSDPNPLVQLLPLLLLVAVFYFLLIRPQQRRMRQQRSLVESLDVGAEILTIGGIYGTISSVEDDAFGVEIAPGTRVRLLKSAVARRLDEPAVEEEAGEGS
jgi:preprotein translocase subunit YajC